MRTMRLVTLIPLGLTLLGCSSECAPVSGGVLVSVRGASSCEAITVTATDGTNVLGFEATQVKATDAGFSCEFQGLTGYPGSFTLQVYVSGQLAASQAITVRKLDECNVSAEMVTVDLGL